MLSFAAYSKLHAIRTPALVTGGLTLTLWGCITLVTIGHFMQLSAVPGASAAAPESSKDNRNTLLIFLHPRCPCSRATMSELARAVAKFENPVNITVFFNISDSADSDWKSTSLYEQAARLPSAKLVADVGGEQTKRYGVETSGQVLVYRHDGQLTFAGGVTGSRGHEGDNNGKARLIAAINSGGSVSAKSLVYGCQLSTPTELSKLKVSP